MPVIEVDFTGVETGAGFLAPGAYEAEVVKVESPRRQKLPGLLFIVGQCWNRRLKASAPRCG